MFKIVQTPKPQNNYWDLQKYVSYVVLKTNIFQNMHDWQYESGLN